MKILDTYLEQIQNSGSISSSGMGFKIDSYHTNKQTLTDRLKSKDKKEKDVETKDNN